MTEVWAALSAYEGEFDLEKENCILISSGKNWVEQAAKDQLFAVSRLPGAVKAVGLPDLHPGWIPVGTAVLSRGILYPHLLGNDIGCGMSLFDTGIKKKKFKQEKWVSRLEAIRDLEGSVLWICKSPYRPGHKRKNWYVDVSILDQVPRISEERMVRFETFCSGGKGGQHVNKVETGVRAIHIPTGTAVVSTQARSQHMNKQIAMNRLCCILAEMNARNQQKEKSLAWMEHARLERGNPVRIYEGMRFERSR